MADFPEGAIGHEQRIDIVTDYHSSGPNRCRHAIPLSKTDTEYERPRHLDEGEEDETPDGYQFITPTVVIAYNQAGHDCTVVCVDCITDAARSTWKLPDDDTEDNS